MPWKQDHFRTAGDLWIALYSIGAHKINETDKIITEQPKLELVSTRKPSSILPISSAGFRLVFKEEQEFKDAINDATYSELEFEVYSIAQEKFLLSKLLTRKKTIALLNSRKHPCNRLLEICVLSIEGMLAKELESNSKAMTRPFLDADKIFKPFYDYVLEAANPALKNLIARLFHLAQSSGTGKTMLCLYLIEKLRNGIYCVYREKGSIGFPPTNDWTSLLVSKFSDSRSDQQAVKICLAFILAALESVTVMKQSSSGVNLRSMYVKASAAFNEIFKSKFHQANLKFAPELVVAINGFSNNLIGDCFPIIIDECDAFLCLPNNNPQRRISLYRAFRRALMLIRRKRIVAVFLGTKSSLNNFVLNYRLDISSRPGTTAVRPINPYIFVHSFDVFLTGNVQISYQALVNDKKVNPTSLQQTAIKCGRPLWNLYDSYDEAMKSAAIKLLADKKIAMMSAFVMRTGAPVVPSCQLAHRLVLSGMATLEFVDVDGESCYVSYCAEPVLASAARLYCGSLDNLDVVLAKFLDYVDKRYVLDSGSAGEFVARIIALRAVDRASEVNLTQTQSIPCASVDKAWLDDQEGHIDPVFPDHTQKYPSCVLITLQDFLTNLTNLNKDDLAGLNLSEEMLDGLVNVSQFIVAKRPFHCDQLTLMHAFIRSVGFSLPTGAKGADLMIPVLRSDNCFSAVMIQVKNLSQLSIPGANTQSSQEFVEKLTCYYTGLDLSAKADLKAVPDNECAKIVFQFADQRARAIERTPALVAFRTCPRVITEVEGSGADAVEKTKNIVEKGDVLWMLGLNGFAHLFADNSIQSQNEASILSKLNCILSGARDYVDALPPSMTPLFTDSQNKREGIRNLINTSIPLKSTDYLILQDSSFRQAYRVESDMLTKALQKYGLSAKTKKLEFTVGDVLVAAKEVQTTDAESSSPPSSSPNNSQESDSGKEKKRKAAEHDEPEEQPASSRQRRN